MEQEEDLWHLARDQSQLLKESFTIIPLGWRGLENETSKWVGDRREGVRVKESTG